MNFYQVNQNTTFRLEFPGGYLCCPDGPFAGWPEMKKLQVGDILFHYNSTCGAVLAVSRVITIGKHKGSGTTTACVISGTQCRQYTGSHLSMAAFSKKKAAKMQEKWRDYLEVHTAVHTPPKKQGNFGKLLPRVPLCYLIKVEDSKGRAFLAKHGIQP